MAPGFKPVGWVAAVASAAIGCYMLSLNVASERAELLKIERRIIATKQDIRTLQTELGTRGRLAQLEQWNAEVLALSAPTTGQFLESEIKLARFDREAPSIDDRAEVQMAAAQPVPAPAQKIEAPVLQASVPVVPAVPAAAPRSTLVRQASLALPTQQGEAVPLTPKPSAKLPPVAVPAKFTPKSPSAAAKLATKSAPKVAAKPATTPIATKPQTAAATPASRKPPKPVVLAAASPKSPKLAGTTVDSSAKLAKPSRAASSRLDPSLARELGAAAKIETSRSNR